MSTDCRGCHELVRPDGIRCDIEVLCPVGESEGAQVESDERDEEAAVRQEGEEAQEPMRRKPEGSSQRRNYEFIGCHILHFVIGVLNAWLEGPRIGLVDPGTVRRH